MKIRTKFTKQNQAKFVGHLDTVRFFQRAIKASGIALDHSKGFNPHALVYFAMPLSVGVSSIGEYMDLVTLEDMDPQEVKTRLNNILPTHVRIVDAFEVEAKDSLMSLVKAADYTIHIPLECLTQEMTDEAANKLDQEQLLIIKKGKKGPKEVDIKPLIQEVTFEEESSNLVIHLCCLAGSEENLSPELFLKAIFNAEFIENLPYAIERTELYAREEDALIPIDQRKSIQ